VIIQRDQTKALFEGGVILGEIAPLCFIKQVFILLSEDTTIQVLYIDLYSFQLQVVNQYSCHMMAEIDSRNM
jgi:hypothetical protein